MYIFILNLLIKLDTLLLKANKEFPHNTAFS